MTCGADAHAVADAVVDAAAAVCAVKSDSPISEPLLSVNLSDCR